MDLKPCRECGQPVSTEATTCPHCGVPQPTKASVSLVAGAPEPAARAEGQPKPLKPRSRSNVRLWCLVAGLLVLITVIGSIDIETADERWRKDPATEAARICKHLVQEGLDRDRLSTATFAPFTMKWIDHPPIFVARGEVTAQNRAGMPVTDQFFCSIGLGSGSGGLLRSWNPERYDTLVSHFDP